MSERNISDDEIAAALDKSLGHVERFEMVYTDDARTHVRLTITMRPIVHIEGGTPLPIDRVGAAAQRAVTVFTTGCIANFALHVRDRGLLSAMQAIVGVALAKPDPAVGSA